MARDHKKELATITSSELSGLIYSPLSTEIDKPFSRQIFLTHVNVAGCAYVRYIKKYISELNVGDRVILLREPKNEYDDLAILVKDLKKRKLGYVPRARNHVMARLMDAGKLLYGEVTELYGPDEDEFPWRAITIAIYMED